MILLKRKNAEVAISPEKGALIRNLTLAGQKVIAAPNESSGSAFPDGGLPMCFPFAGRVWHQNQVHRYALPGDTPDNFFLMPIHGFAHSLPWIANAHNEHSATFELKDTNETRQVYPFSFSLEFAIDLQSESHVDLRVKVKHLKSLHGIAKEMPVALGFHPYFFVPERASWTLEHAAQHSYVVTPIGAAGKVSELAENSLPLSDVRAKSLIMDSHQKKKMFLKSKKQNYRIELSWGNLLQKTVLWQPAKDDVQCVEPWMALPDAVAVASGAQWLKEGESMATSFAIEIVRT